MAQASAVCSGWRLSPLIFQWASPVVRLAVSTGTRAPENRLPPEHHPSHLPSPGRSHPTGNLTSGPVDIRQLKATETGSGA